VIADLEDLRALFRRWVHRLLQHHAQKRLAPRHGRAAEQDVHENRPAGGQFAGVEGFGFAIVPDYLAEFVFFVEVHDMLPIQY
jgi:hypothetical protein